MSIPKPSKWATTTMFQHLVQLPLRGLICNNTFESLSRLVIRIAVDDSKSMVRLSPKFGARLPTVRQLLGRARELNLEVVGVSFHVGSGCTRSSAFRQAIEDARRVFDVAVSHCDINATIIPVLFICSSSMQHWSLSECFGVPDETLGYWWRIF